MTSNIGFTFDKLHDILKIDFQLGVTGVEQIEDEHESIILMHF